ncbi:hypothetical protein BRADI_2g11591v3 [Brachypodium distachyon]|uniref:Uncharacterized protein n=1 Tax=Brachypodium distachyon TaxID=15368 RepID=A0A2K2D816_BRADI|nr:hypothetical protein BRADI_2g11591v3 [Brachypodium distachyon]PNT70420.1 hypothetical protein BRADI_2g11591v3 [Brachypodium distachyon]PNT70421.1 hypothetical protein BRADI_2g11591v3 [Brachypodium distachyon]PNT70422.1 hypothetical protein BRADI_2g11591v3 [Brachypodium distachyon]PNT70423.1 hypothetical protein BRADI_2g11591v3 [Brachypodium distachyon]
MMTRCIDEDSQSGVLSRTYTRKIKRILLLPSRINKYIWAFLYPFAVNRINRFIKSILDRILCNLHLEGFCFGLKKLLSSMYDLQWTLIY